MLNDNAKKVSPTVRAELAAIVPPNDLFFSHTIEEANQITEELVRRRYPVVFTGGGDGTVIDFIDRITRAAEAHPDYPCPHIGILRLGTGNALAQMVSSGSYICDIKAYIANGFQELQRLSLIEAEGRRFPFTGLGWDAEILNDYRYVKKQWGEKPVIGPLVQNVGGYFAAFFARTMPRITSRTVRRSKPEIRVTNLGERALRLGEGAVVRAVYPEGEVLYEGTFASTMAGTSPFYGFGLKILPFAGLTPNYFHLRVATLSMMSALYHLDEIWAGEFADEHMRDFYAQRVRLDFSQPVPFQIGGDAEGWRDSVELTLSKASVQLVRFI